jgi:hypothetical protein
MAMIMSANILLALGGVIGLYFWAQGLWFVAIPIFIIAFILDQTLKIGWYDMVPGLHVNGVFDGKPIIEDNRETMGIPTARTERLEREKMVKQ